MELTLLFSIALRSTGRPNVGLHQYELGRGPFLSIAEFFGDDLSATRHAIFACPICIASHTGNRCAGTSLSRLRSRWI